MKKFYSLCALCALLITSVNAYANTVTVPSDPSASISTTTYLPIAINAGSSNQSAGCYSVSQQLYYASELAGASSNTINAITFYYNEGTTMTRKLRVWISNTSLDDFPTPNSTNTPNFVAPGTKVFSGDVNLKEPDPYTITFNTPYVWDGTSNIVVTVFDSTGLFNSIADLDVSTVHTPRTQMFADDGKVRFLHKISRDKNFDNAGWTMDNLTAATAYSITPANRKYANKITFTFAPAAVIPAVPSDLVVSSTTASSATLSWSAVEGATSYDLQQSTDGENWSTLSLGETGTSFNWTELSAGSTQFARIRANNANGSSNWSSAVTVTTDAIHSHDGLTFSKWTSTNSLPAEAGNYYLNADVVLPNHYTVPANINLCLNGHSIYTYYFNIVVRDNKTLAIYDNVGGGRIYGYYVGDNSSYYGLVSIADGGTFVLNGGSVENLADDFNNAGEVSYGIYNNATLKLSGDPTIIGYHGDIYLAYSRLITIESGKPLTNTTPYSIYKATLGPITDGWSNMSGANPSAFFTSKEESYGVCYNSSTSEAELVRVFTTSDNNASIKTALEDGTYKGRLVNFKITSRSFTSAQYNTICLPFALTNEQLEDVFGAGYDLEAFDHSNFDGETLELTFDRKYSLIEGEPYLIKPSIDVVNPVFDGVTFYISEPGTDDLDDYIHFQGTFAPTELEGGNKNVLFLGAGNELFWPESTGNLKGFRAYFEVKGDARKAVRARISKKEEHTTDIGDVRSENANAVRSEKIFQNGQILIKRDGKTYNVLGSQIR